MSKVVRILSIDGGGIRGIIPAMVMAAIEGLTGQPICKLFDLVAGTSTGGVLALGATLPKAHGSTEPMYAAADGVELYEQNGARIFDTDLWRQIGSLWNVTDEKYPSEGVEAVLKDKFDEGFYLRESLTDVLITAYEIERRIPWFFRSSRAKTDPSYDFRTWQVARATSAAPTYFEPCKIEVGGAADYYALVDGGVFANNPTMCAYVEAKATHDDIEHILVVSLGTGQSQMSIPYAKAKDWGLIEWVQPILDILIHGAGDTVNHQMQLLLPEASGKRWYYRFDMKLNNDMEDLDNATPDNIRALKLAGERLIYDQNQDLWQLCDHLKELVK